MGSEQIVGDRQGVSDGSLELKASRVVVALGEERPIETALAHNALDLKSTGQAPALEEHTLKGPCTISDSIVQEAIRVILTVPPPRCWGQRGLRAPFKQAEAIQGAVPPDGQPALPIPRHPTRTEGEVTELSVQFGPEVQSEFQRQCLRELGFRTLVHAVDHEVSPKPDALLGPAVHFQQEHGLTVGIPHEDGGRLAAVVRERLLLVPDKTEEPIKACKPNGAGRFPDERRTRLERRGPLSESEEENPLRGMPRNRAAQHNSCSGLHHGHELISITLRPVSVKNTLSRKSGFSPTKPKIHGSSRVPNTHLNPTWLIPVDWPWAILAVTR